MLLLDWEYAHATDPLWDLAAWCANNDLDEGLRRELFACYAGRPPTRVEWQRVTLLCWLYDYVCLLWSGLRLGGQDEAAMGVAARARTIAARLRKTSGSRADQDPAK